jgi:hypothetical protein
MYFQQIKEDFTFPYKIYGHNSNLIDRVAKAYNNTTGNIGILLNGIKVTCKSETAEIICNKMSAENIKDLLKEMKKKTQIVWLVFQIGLVICHSIEIVEKYF